jgi:hypothetical protein
VVVHASTAVEEVVSSDHETRHGQQLRSGLVTSDVDSGNGTTHCSSSSERLTTPTRIGINS